MTCNGDMKVLGVILDLDGTLLNTEKATKDILKEFLERYGKVVDRDKEDKRLGMMHMESVTSMVKDYELPLTPDQFSKEIRPLYHQKWPLAKPLPGANRLIRHLHNHGIPFALASNSITKNIEKKISHQGWKELFSTVLGSDQVQSGKPSPDIFLEAAKRMGVDATRCVVIEDSVIGVMAGKAAGMKVVAVPSLKAQADRYSIADSVLNSLLEFRPELWGLSAFEDWMGNALPVEPMYLNGLVSNGLLCEVADDGPTALPDQVSGIYFGWAKLDTHEIIKIVVGIGWQQKSFSAVRVIKPFVVDAYDKDISGQKLQIVLVGYIRRLIYEASEMDLNVLEEDMSIAKEALDLPIFFHDRSNTLMDEAALMENNAALSEQE
ncbi:hypothetical protein IFM89_019460 [Coptis chinensis]|uniref:riboflavin kinase n=1 Tax=Coptis chinensis TaxID=261450 RepID=A0A835GYF6_9MAGN|nr:hypothetical protein IFM89_019460 [Coptis chinensis]